MRSQYSSAYDVINVMYMNHLMPYPQTFVLSYAGRSHLNAYHDVLRQFTIREGGIAKVDMYEYNGEFVFGFIFNKKSGLYARRFLEVLADYGLNGSIYSETTLPEEIG